MQVEFSGTYRRTATLCLALGAPLLLLVYVLAANAWILDDAYITFRSVENFVSGYGLRWNVDERVQVFTHPLWFFIISALYSITSEFYLTALIACLAFSLAAACSMAWFVTEGLRGDLWKVPLYFLALISSKAVIDYSSSGLENAFSYFLATVFTICLLSKRGRLESRLFWLTLFASLAFLNRQDTILLYVPSLVWWIASQRRTLSKGALARACVATLPALSWLVFSIFYYGYAFPNTSYAKLSSTGFPAAWRLERGLAYLENSLAWDFPLYGLMLLGIGLCVRRRNYGCLSIYVGTCAYLVYVALFAGSATHLTGRFTALPLFVGISLFVCVLDSRKWAVGLASALIVFNFLNPGAAIKFGTEGYNSDITLFRSRPLTMPEQVAARNHIDAKKYIYPNFVPLVSNWRPRATYGNDNAFYQAGLQLRTSPGRVHVGGFRHGEAVGYFGYAAGPEKFIVDRVGLTDPLLSRLPALKPQRIEQWTSGHFHRQIPPGYLESVASNLNLLEDPSLRTYYDKIRLVTRGPLFDWDRLREIWKLNTGAYDPLIEAYIANKTKRRRP